MKINEYSGFLGLKQFKIELLRNPVNIALICNNRPILGVVYIPVKDILYYGDENGSFKIENDKLVKLEKKGEWNEKEKINVVASRSNFNKETRRI